MPVESMVVLELHAAQPKRPPLHKAMHIVPNSSMNHARIIVSYSAWPRENMAMPAATEALSELTRPH